jgi:DNA (cytosine-5)-methyltransferase 1
MDRNVQPLKLGELFAGYGGLGMAVEEVFGAQTAWFSEFEEAPSKILAHHWPGVPNHGDVTKIDWASVEPVDIISGGSPCQDLSLAGKRRGMTEGTRSNLWESMREGIATIRPRYVVWENVRGAYSACATSEMGQCPGCLDRRQPHRPFLRALGRVLGDLADLGFNAEWRGLRASDVGAPHGRFRVFVLAANNESAARGGSKQQDLSEAFGSTAELGERTSVAANSHDFRSDRSGSRAEQNGRGQSANGSVTSPHAISEGLEGSHDQAGAAQAERHGHSGAGTDWGKYSGAVRRWEAVRGTAPAPIEPGSGAPRLSAKLTEWMMGLPDGWVTDPTIGISRSEQLKACGNGVVPQQAAAALRDMLAALEPQRVAA